MKRLDKCLYMLSVLVLDFFYYFMHLSYLLCIILTSNCKSLRKVLFTKYVTTADSNFIP